MSSLMQFHLAPHTLVFEAGGDYPAKRVHSVMQVSGLSAGGTRHTETLGVQKRTRVIQFNEMSQVDYFALVDWFLNISNGAKNTFEFTDEYGDVGNVKILNSDLDFNETSMGLYSGSILLEYV